MTYVSSSPFVLAELLDIVETALTTVSRHLPAHVGREDLASAGKLALIAAMGQIDGELNEVRAYCFVRVRGAMLDELRRLDSLTRNQRQQVNQLAQAETSLNSSLGREASLDELVAASRLSVSAVTAILRRRELDAEPSDVAWTALPDTESLSPLEVAEQIDLQALLRSALARLPANQALALRLYYLEDASLDTIAAQMHVSRERARQVREAGEKKLRADLAVLAIWQSMFA